MPSIGETQFSAVFAVFLSFFRLYSLWPFGLDRFRQKLSTKKQGQPCRPCQKAQDSALDQ
ncbi:hypothetical protein TH25_05490 [Thalassospira profundimaris]|uniref:Uncharacterized protein n=1 Tax=Thalassospira profundimaris TaxID=502049 RepID=A0A367XFM8_9PROT|nr:hypothetical protein TH25_05490 [Thalassospira profundimaris]